jgi:uncharacterized protein YjbI with pentapeptide repeats
VTQDPRTTQGRAIKLLRATLATTIWLPDTEAKHLVWAIRCALVAGLVAVVASVVEKGLWDWLDLLVVPAVLAIGGYLFTSAQNRAAQAAAARRPQDEALQAYLDRLGQLLIDRDLRNKRDTTDLRTLADAYTLTALGGLDGRRKRTVIRFLRRARLIYADQPRVIALDGADLEGMGLCNRVQTMEDVVGETDLNARAERLGVSPHEIAQISGPVNLMSVDLSRANLRDADLGGADLSFANLSGADLSGTNLHEAFLLGVRGISEQQLDEQCKVLIGATMPNGQYYEDWLKDRAGRNDNAEND